MAEYDNVESGYISVSSTNNFTVPNFLTFIRILLIIPFVIFFFKCSYLAAAIVILISGLTDCLDGFIARKFNQVSQLGKYLDPIADKLTLFAVGICIMSILPILIPVMCVLIIKEAVMIAGAWYLLRKSINPPPAQWFGKASTVVFYAVAIISMVMYVFDIRNYSVIIVLFSIAAICMLCAVFGYYKIFKKLLNDTSNLNTKYKV